ncbi:CLUMA_CG017621, isoform A [Clunio marinus]|uniref:CLUMA_CG017621, isoform A n=1 Tax=Clunio marinus TaxID=568069 RepID=A0A1J1IWG1_9DIPT|nr:CLUMA_CG017621, isoform A [Clunio marinus]
MFLKIWLIFSCLLVLNIFFVFSANQKCFNICPDAINYDFFIPLREFIMSNLIEDGPADGICLTKDKWIFNGTQFGLPPKCRCMEFPPAEEINPNDGPRCPDHLQASVEESINENLKRNLELRGDEMPENGWCPEGKTKWMILKSQLDVPRDGCVCIDAFNPYSPEIVCIEDDN